MSKTAISPHAVGVLNITNSLTYNKCTVAAGGVFIVGRICFINLRLATTENWSAGQKFLQGLPTPLNGNNTNSTGFRLVYQNLDMGCLLNASGECSLSTNSDTPLSGSAVLINAAYVIDGNEILNDYTVGSIVENITDHLTWDTENVSDYSNTVLTKIGGMRFLQFQVRRTSGYPTARQSYTVATLPTGDIPTKTTAVSVYGYTSTGQVIDGFRLGVNTAGAITVGYEEGTSSNIYVRGQIFWYVG